MERVALQRSCNVHPALERRDRNVCEGRMQSEGSYGLIVLICLRNKPLGANSNGKLYRVCALPVTKALRRDADNQTGSYYVTTAP